MKTLKNINQNNLLSDLIKEILNNSETHESENKILFNLIEKVEKQEFTIAVLGTWNSGKSTLLNRILFDSKEVLPIADEPTTSKITRIRYSESPSLDLIALDGEKERIADTDKAITEKLKELGTAQNEVNVEEITNELDLNWNSDVLKSGVIAVDTPGLEDVNVVRSQLTKKYIDFCDAVIIITTLQNPLTEELKTFLEKKVYIKNAKKIFFLINKCDRFDPEDEEETPEEMRKYIAEQINEISEENIENITNQIFTVSARTGEGIGSFENSLVSFLNNEKEKVYLKSVSNTIESILDQIESKIELEEKSIDSNKEDLQKTYNDKQVTLKKLKENIVPHLDVLRDDFNKIKPHTEKIDTFCGNLINGIDKIKKPGSVKTVKNFAWDSRTKEIKKLLEEEDIEKTINEIKKDLTWDTKNVLEKFTVRLDEEIKKTENVKYDFEIDDLRELNNKINNSSKMPMGVGVGVGGIIALGGATGLTATGLLTTTAATTTTISAIPGFLGGGTSAAGWIASHGFFAAQLTSTAVILSPIAIATGGVSLVVTATIIPIIYFKTNKNIEKIKKMLKEKIDEIRNRLEKNIKESLNIIYKTQKANIDKYITEKEKNDLTILKTLEKAIDNKQISEESKKLKELIPAWREKLNLTDSE